MAILMELKCSNCGSSDLREENGVYVCQACGSRFVLNSPAKTKADKYRDKMLCAMTDPDNDDKDEECRRIAVQRKYTKKLLEILPEDPYGWVSKTALRIEDGIDTEWSVRECVEDAGKALEYSQKYSNNDEKKDIAQFVANNLEFHRPRILKNLAWKYEKEEFLDILHRAQEICHQNHVPFFSDEKTEL